MAYELSQGIVLIFRSLLLACLFLMAVNFAMFSLIRMASLARGYMTSRTSLCVAGVILLL